MDTILPNFLFYRSAAVYRCICLTNPEIDWGLLMGISIIGKVRQPQKNGLAVAMRFFMFDLAVPPEITSYAPKSPVNATECATRN